MQKAKRERIHPRGGKRESYIRQLAPRKSVSVHVAMGRELSEEQIAAAQAVILSHGRELCAPKEFERNRWQSIMAAQKLEGEVSQQAISKFVRTGRMAPDTLRWILRKLGEDPDEVLGTETAPSGPDPTDMSPYRAKVLWRNAQWYPAEVVEEVRRLPLDADRSGWTEPEWIHALDETWHRWLRAKALKK